MNKLVYVLDDEKDITDLLEINLKKNGFQVKAFNFPRDFEQALFQNIPDLAILDIMLPGKDGLEIYKDMQKKDKFRQVPVVFLSAKTDEIDRILGLELGANDYVTKPFSVRELMVRIKNILKRIDSAQDTPAEITQKEEILEYKGILKINFKSYSVYENNEKKDLTSTEYKILTLLLQKRGWVLSRDEILNYLWGNEKYVVDRSIDVHVSNLRKKLPETGKYIKNIRSIGYTIEE